MKLKTLKDFGENECGFGENHIDKNDLKQEAIKWIKHDLIMGYDEGTEVNRNVKDWIKHFFNITEEDLK